MNNFFNNILHGKYVSSRLILVIDILVSTLASWIAILSVGALMSNLVLARTTIVCYTMVAMSSSLIFLWLCKTHQSIIRHMKLRGMARCMKSERQGHFVFYGAMVAEGVIALIWAAAGCSLYEVTGGLSTGLAEVLKGGQSAAIYDVCKNTMGGVGVALAMIGVIVCPITSGDTAFRSARLTLADWIGIEQKDIKQRLILTVPLLGAGALIGHLDYTVVWRYFSWTNQTLAMIVLWTASMFLYKEKKNYWITAVPATFMSAVSMTYFFCAPECLGMIGFTTKIAYPAGLILAACFLGIFLHATKKAS